MILIVLICAIVFVFILISINLYNNNNNMEHIVNLSTCKKDNVEKCCSDNKCYRQLPPSYYYSIPSDEFCDAKPPFLRNNCEENKIASKKELDKSFQPMFSLKEYNELVGDLHLYDNYYTDNSNNIVDQDAFNKKFDYQADYIEKQLGDQAFNKIMTSNYGEVPGYNI